MLEWWSGGVVESGPPSLWELRRDRSATLKALKPARPVKALKPARPVKAATTRRGEGGEAAVGVAATNKSHRWTQIKTQKTEVKDEG